jgi:hypothetical protein
VATLRREIEAWRTGKKGGEAMPAALWEAAVALALASSVCEVSRWLSVDYGKLKRLVVEAQGRAAVTEPEFVELAGLFESSALAVVEMQRADGTRMRIELPEGKVDAVLLATTFLRGAA